MTYAANLMSGFRGYSKVLSLLFSELLYRGSEMYKYTARKISGAFGCNPRRVAGCSVPADILSNESAIDHLDGSFRYLYQTRCLITLDWA